MADHPPERGLARVPRSCSTVTMAGIARSWARNAEIRSRRWIPKHDRSAPRTDDEIEAGLPGPTRPRAPMDEPRAAAPAPGSRARCPDPGRALQRGAAGAARADAGRGPG